MANKVKSLYYDWKDKPDAADLKAALKPFGVYVYDSIGVEGSDMYGFVFSEKPLTKKEILEHEASVGAIPEPDDDTASAGAKSGFYFEIPVGDGIAEEATLDKLTEALEKLDGNITFNDANYEASTFVVMKGSPKDWPALKKKIEPVLKKYKVDLKKVKLLDW